MESEIKKRDNTYCCVPQCTSRGSRNPDLSFHKFPREKNNVPESINKAITMRRKHWILILRIGKQVSRRMTVCSKHFCASDFMKTALKRPKLKPTAVPSQNLPVPVSSCNDKDKQLESLKQQEGNIDI